MSDKTVLEEMFNRTGIPFTISSESPWETPVGTAFVLTVEVPKIEDDPHPVLTGYCGFVTYYAFDATGKLLQLAIFE
jgi:hypothetical protein